MEQARYLRQEIGVHAQLAQPLDVQIAERLAFVLGQAVVFHDGFEIGGEIRIQRRIAADLEDHPVRRQLVLGVGYAHGGVSLVIIR